MASLPQSPLIKRIEVRDLRGIASGELHGLGRISILVGSNGSGKSTILEAALIAGTSVPASAAGFVVRHRFATANGARWLVRNGSPETAARVSVTWTGDLRVERTVRWDEALVIPETVEELARKGAPPPYSAFRIFRDEPLLKDKDKPCVTAMASDNSWLPLGYEDPPIETPELRFVEPRLGEPLHDLFSRAVKAGRRKDCVASAQGALPTIQDLEILTEEGAPRLFARTAEGAVPATLAGDGVQALLRSVFELAAAPGGTVLLEEPEVHQYPKTLRQTAKAIVVTARRGVQVILTTHSLELVDYILAELSNDEVEDAQFLTVIRTQLREGKLLTARFTASEAERARTEIEEDLR